MRGITLAVINPHTFAVEHAQAYDTNGSPAGDTLLFNKLKEVKDSGLKKIFAMVVSDDAYVQLSVNTKNLIQELGSKEIAQLAYRQPWAFIGSFHADVPKAEMRNEDAPKSFAYAQI